MSALFTSCRNCGSSVTVATDTGSCPECGAALGLRNTPTIGRTQPIPARFANRANAIAPRSRVASFPNAPSVQARPGTLISLPGDFGLTQNLCGNCGQPVKTFMTSWGHSTVCSSCGPSNDVSSDGPCVVGPKGEHKPRTGNLTEEEINEIVLAYENCLVAWDLYYYLTRNGVTGVPKPECPEPEDYEYH